jgi:hypothetical protein
MLFRREELRMINVELATLPYDKLMLEPVLEPTEQQRRAYESWLGQGSTD